MDKEIFTFSWFEVFAIVINLVILGVVV